MPRAMLPPSEHIPKGYVQFEPGGPLFHQGYLDRHPTAAARLLARRSAVRVPPPPSEPTGADVYAEELRRQLAEAVKVIAELRHRVESLETQLAATAVIPKVDPAEVMRRMDVRRHAPAYTAYVLRCMLADLEAPEGT